jgi:hypothetical protein
VVTTVGDPNSAVVSLDESNSLDNPDVTLRIYMSGLDSAVRVIVCLQDHNDDGVCQGKPIDVEDLYSANFKIRRSVPTHTTIRATVQHGVLRCKIYFAC